MKCESRTSVRVRVGVGNRRSQFLIINEFMLVNFVKAMIREGCTCGWGGGEDWE